MTEVVEQVPGTRGTIQEMVPGKVAIHVEENTYMNHSASKTIMLESRETQAWQTH